MTPEEQKEELSRIYSEMAELANNPTGDPERDGGRSNKLLCDALRALNHNRLVEMWLHVERYM
jgi:hypothetical protein